MKKKQAALCIFDLIMCVLLLFVFINKLSANDMVEGMIGYVLNEEAAIQEQESPKKIAITFDEEVIIGLSQEMYSGRSYFRQAITARTGNDIAITYFTIFCRTIMNNFSCINEYFMRK